MRRLRDISASRKVMEQKNSWRTPNWFIISVSNANRQQHFLFEQQGGKLSSTRTTEDEGRLKCYPVWKQNDSELCYIVPALGITAGLYSKTCGCLNTT